MSTVSAAARGAVLTREGPIRGRRVDAMAAGSRRGRSTHRARHPGRCQPVRQGGSPLRARDASASASVSSPTLEADSMDSMDSMDEGEPVVRTAPAVSAKASHIASLTNEAELDALIDLLPPRVRGALATHPRKLQLLEVVLDLGRLPIARFADGDEILGDGLPLDYDDIERAMDPSGRLAAITARASTGPCTASPSFVTARAASWASPHAWDAPSRAARIWSGTCSRRARRCSSWVGRAWGRRRRFERSLASFPRSTAGAWWWWTPATRSEGTGTFLTPGSAGPGGCRCPCRTGSTTC